MTSAPPGPPAANPAAIGSQPFTGDAPAQPSDPSADGPGVSSWLAYPRPIGCCDLTGRNGPIGSEVYVRTGTSVPIGGGLFGSVMKPGWDVEGGVRALLFNPEQTRAWTADLSVTNIHYYTSTAKSAPLINFASQVTIPSTTGGTPTTQTVIIPQFFVTPAGLNDTTVNLAFGRECYLIGAANTCSEPRWRIGGDVGGRWGSSRLDLVEIKHKTGSISGFFFSLHSDLEIPCGCCILFAGLRMEYGYTFSKILQQQNDTDLQVLNFVGTVGLRF
jgi:hypothetical protein